MTTKEQERKALEKIRKIVAELGEDSYIATALDGCLEDAERNIDDDAAYSMKDRFEKTAKELHNQYKIVSELGKKITKYEEHIQKLEKRSLNDDDLIDCLHLAEDKRTECNEKAKKAAEKIVEHADDPESYEFKESVNENRFNKKLAEYYNELAHRLGDAC